MSNKTTRIKNPVTQILTRAEVEQLVNIVALAMNEKRKLNAKVDAAKLAIDDRHAPFLQTCNETIDTWFATLQQWAEAHPEEFAKKKSIKFPSGVIGFRQGTPKLLETGKKSTEEIMDMLRAIEADYIREKQEIDAQRILADFGQGFIDPGELAKVGLEVTSEKTFYIKPALTETEATTAAPTEEAA